MQLRESADRWSGEGVPGHTDEFKWRRFFNWFPLGMGYASLMFMRYILYPAKTGLGSVISISDFNLIFASGTTCYLLGFLALTAQIDRRGGRWGMLVGVMGAVIANLLMALILYGNAKLGWNMPVFWSLLVLYSINMFFQSCGAASIVTTKLPWFHVRHRGTFGTIFGFMISLGIYFAFDWGFALMSATRAHVDHDKLGVMARFFLNILGCGGNGINENWWLFLAPALFAFFFWCLMSLTLRNKPSDAGFMDFDTGDQVFASRSLSMWEMVKDLFTNPAHRVLRIVVAIEFCSGALRNGIIQNYPNFAKAIGFEHHFWVSHNWGLALCLCGFLGAYTTGRVSDRFFQSRRGPMAFYYYIMMAACVSVMLSTLFLNNGDAGSWFTAIPMLVTAAGVIGVHGILSGTATGDFTGVQNTAKVVGIVDGAVYAGSGVYSLLMVLGGPNEGNQILVRAWVAWPLMLIPFALLGIFLCHRIFDALPKRTPQPPSNYVRPNN